MPINSAERKIARLRHRLALTEHHRDLAEETLTRVETERIEAIRQRDAEKAYRVEFQDELNGEIMRLQAELSVVTGEREEARDLVRDLVRPLPSEIDWSQYGWINGDIRLQTFSTKAR